MKESTLIGLSILIYLGSWVFYLIHAIVRHRLFDIDLVINRTVVFGALAAFVTGVYVAIVVGLGSALGRVGEPSVALQIAATAVVAVAFQPVRERVQRLANRLVYGERATPYEVMAGFGRTGRWFAIDHWGVVPDLLTMAKGLTSAYVQLGAVGMRRPIADHFRENVFYGGLTYNSHPLGCAAALATIRVYEEDGLIERAARMGEVLARHLADLEARHPSVGAVRNIGLFGIVELVRRRDPWTPLAPYNGTSDEMAALARFFRENGLYTFVRWNTFFTNPPLIISEAEMAEAFEIIDRGLAITDEAVAD